MAYYLYQLSYSQDAIKAMVANPSDREAAARKLIEAPEDTVMMACAAAVASAGTVSGSSTIKLMTASDAMAAMTLAGKVTAAYKPPHG